MSDSEKLTAVAIIGCGFVADLYLKSIRTASNLQVAGAFDINDSRLQKFCEHWDVTSFQSLEALFAAMPMGSVILNLTNPHAHYDVNKACLEAGFHTYSEKPLAMEMDHARALYDLAQERGLMLASAPCSALGEAAQTLAYAVRNEIAGSPQLIYAELDDGYIPQAPVKDWQSESGAPWPYEDEFRVGCTLEHAGYYLSWLIGMFGTVKTVVAASGTAIPNKLAFEDAAPDTSVAVLFFENGPMVRLTCTIVAPHDHQIRVIGDKGVLKLDRAWDNAAPIKFHKRLRLRRRLIDMPIGQRVRLKAKTHPKVKRWGAAAMNFALGPMEMVAAIEENRECRLNAAFALHLNEVTLAIQNAGDHSGAQQMTTTCSPMEPMEWAR